MIERYSRPQMTKIWSDENKFQKWLAIEIAVCEAQAELGLIPAAALQQIKSKATFNIERIKTIEAEVKHDVIAFLTNVNEYLGEAGRFVHMGLTSSDVVDTALALQMKEAAILLEQELKQLTGTVLGQARKHKHTVQIGRSHGIHAEPITFGFKLAVWREELLRHEKRLNEAKENIAFGKLSGAVGTYSNISPQVEVIALAKLGLSLEPISTQIVQRDRHAQFMFTLALIGASLEKFAIEIRHLQRTDVLEAEEPFTVGQKGSSAMPHKRNPVGSENISGLARVLRGNALAALENIALWHERDISHSSVERVIMPDSTILLDYMLDRFNGIMKDLVIYPENMQRNMSVFGGVVFSQAVLLKLIGQGISREDAYALVQKNAMQAWNSDHGNFKENLLKDPSVLDLLSKVEIESCFDAQKYLQNIDQVFARLGI